MLFCLTAIVGLPLYLTYEGDHHGRSNIGDEDDYQARDYGQGDGALGVVRLLPRSGDDVKPDERIEAGGSPREDARPSVRQEALVLAPVVRVHVEEPGGHHKHPYCQVECVQNVVEH